MSGYSVVDRIEHRPQLNAERSVDAWERYIRQSLRHLEAGTVRYQELVYSRLCGGCPMARTERSASVECKVFLISSKS